eukprot:CAMPEP_0182582076 /NCGR_PEP_ID=MMETSP1324-20130603/51651_1 /TAXON_ID=236786 /ORGANISM="Florenciella sp., Strain RCC1587" /LENGTH=86 /DNA_ID=CAMNT_0024798503 /DNA_START=31 /DNA_END=288 /DNA_ORIENTATION=+
MIAGMATSVNKTQQTSHNMQYQRAVYLKGKEDFEKRTYYTRPLSVDELAGTQLDVGALRKKMTVITSMGEEFAFVHSHLIVTCGIE